MESIGAFPEVDWESSLGRMFSSEDLDFTPHFLGQFSFPNYSHNDNVEGMLNLGQPSSICPVISHDQANSESNLFHTLDSLNSNLHFYSQESSHSSTSAAQENYYISDSCHLPITNDVSLPIFPMDHDNVPAFLDNMIIEETLCNVKEDSGNHLKRICNAPELDKTDPESPPNPKKRTRVSRVAQKGKKIVESSKKSQENNTDMDGNSTSSYNSEDDNVSQETNGGAISDTTKPSTAVNSNGKARASRGSATDPQSLYARKRRERINERLRILQNLVPNGTKVDLSTMLEEAVHYVKFLQLQIKLLSSDDLWMYAPLAYNGMDIGLNKTFCQLV